MFNKESIKSLIIKELEEDYHFRSQIKYILEKDERN